MASVVLRTRTTTSSPPVPSAPGAFGRCRAKRARPGRFVGGGGAARFVPRTPVHARVPGKKLVDPVGHHLEGRGRCRRVEVAVGPFNPVDAGHGGGGRRPAAPTGLRSRAGTGHSSIPRSPPWRFTLGSGTRPAGGPEADRGATVDVDGGARRVRAGPIRARAQFGGSIPRTPERGELRELRGGRCAAERGPPRE